MNNELISSDACCKSERNPFAQSIKEVSVQEKYE